ncbi:restriction endonuclease subunit S [Gallibacterium anatis]|uniref:restriction endonuclease subunit S n=1 Tax=Gallibacterium anatis TaxID=750 RepID=UPI00300725E8
MSNIPKLRFPEFTDAWEKCKLGEVIINHSSSNYIQEAKAFGEFEVIQQGNTPIVGYSNEMPFENFENVLCFGDHTTSLYKPLTPFLLATDGVKILSIKGVQGYFILSFFERYKPNAEGYKRHFSILKKQQGYIPPLPEQQKIGNLFKQLDHLITLHKRKWDDVILLKKALLQKMFPKNGSDFPEIRFPEFTDAWEKCKLGKIAIKVTEKNKDGIFQETLTNSAEFGVISQRDFFDKDISNPENLNGYYIVKPNDFVYNPRISNLAPVGPIKRNQLNRIGIMSPLYFIFRVSSNIDLDFLDAFFSTNLWHLFLKLNGDSGARADRIAIKDKIFMEMPISIPTLPEQQKIGNLFKQLDWLITLHKRQHEHYQLLKKALLQKMFV